MDTPFDNIVILKEHAKLKSHVLQFISNIKQKEGMTFCYIPEEELMAISFPHLRLYIDFINTEDSIIEEFALFGGDPGLGQLNDKCIKDVLEKLEK